MVDCSENLSKDDWVEGVWGGWICWGGICWFAYAIVVGNKSFEFEDERKEFNSSSKNWDKLIGDDDSFVSDNSILESLGLTPNDLKTGKG